MIYAVILASGIGSRMNNNIPKQFLMLNNKPIFIYSVETFLKIKEIEKIIICVPNLYFTKTKELIKNYIGLNNKIDIIIGGETRINSLIKGCNYIKDKYPTSKEDIIITHDGVRPFVSKEIILNNIVECKKYGAVTTAVESSDTIIESLSNNKVTKIPNRSNLLNEQTPQTFNLEKLIKYYKKLTKDEINNLTDATNIFILNNRKVSIIKGDYSNIKITREIDLELAKLIIKNKHITFD